MQLINRGADSYEFRMQNGSMMGLRAGNVSFWFGVKNNRLYFTNDYNLVDARVPGLTLRDCPWGQKVSGKRCFVGMNFTSVSDQAKQLLGNNSQYAPAIGVLRILDYMTVETVDYKTSHIELTTKSKDKNVLQTLLEVFN